MNLLQLCVVVWILLLVYKTGLVEQIDDLRPVPGTTAASVAENGHSRLKSDEVSWSARDTTEATMTGGGVGQELAEELWKGLSPGHWPTLFAYYNISLTGRFAVDAFSFLIYSNYIQQSITIL